MTVGRVKKKRNTKDFLGQEINIGNIVLYPSTSRGRHTFIKGKVIGFTKSMVKIEITKGLYGEISEGATTLKCGYNLVIISNE